MPAPLDLSVIVVTHNGRDMALRTLRSLRGAVDSVSAEWFVVDAASTDGTPDAVEESFDDIRVLRCPNNGFAASNNVALRMATGRYVLLVNPDVEVRSGNLDQLVATMDSRPDVGLGSVIQRGANGSLQPSIRRFPTPLRNFGESVFAAHWSFFNTLQELETRPAMYDRERTADWLVGAFLIARSEAVRAVGPLDDRFFLYSEEKDWCYRFWKAGWAVSHFPVMTITHHAGRRWKDDLMAQLSHSRLLFTIKHYGFVERSAIRAALALGHTMRIAAFAPAATLRPQHRARVRAERAGLRIALGLGSPPLGPYSK